MGQPSSSAEGRGAAPLAAEQPVELRRELGLSDLVFTQILFIVGLPWVGVAAKQGPAHVVFWVFAVLSFYIPSAIVVTHLNRRMPLEGGLYQWAKIGFGDRVGFLVAWNLWLFGILNCSDVGIQAMQYAAYIIGPAAEPFASNRLVIALCSGGIFVVLMLLAVRGLSVGKWVHKSGGVLMVLTFAALLLLPWVNLARGQIASFHPLATAAPVISLMSLNLLGKMGFGAFGGFEYVAIHAGECRNPVRTIARSVLIAAPLIAAMFILGTSSVLALVPFDQIDLIAPIPQVLTAGFRPFGSVAWVAPVTIVVLLLVRVAQASVLFTGNTRLPMVAGWDGLLPRWFTAMHVSYQTPVNSILFVGLMTFAFAIAGLVGVGKEEAFQLLWNASAIFYGLTYLVMFALPIVGFARGSEKTPLWIKCAAASGFLMTLLYVTLSVLPIVSVVSRLTFALKIGGVIAATNAIGLAIYARNARSAASVSSGTSSGRK